MVEVVYGGGSATFDGSPGSAEGGTDRFTEDRSPRVGEGSGREKDRERGPGETKVGQWPGHVEKNGAQRAGRRHTVLLIHRPLLAASRFCLPIQETLGDTIVKMRCDLLVATLFPRKEKETSAGKAK